MNCIASERVRMGMSRAQLAEQLGVNPQTIKGWELGYHECSGSNIKRMSDMFGCTADYLLGKTDERLSIRR
jgi:transcriptional regulator with XRE-family HTH domain